MYDQDKACAAISRRTCWPKAKASYGSAKAKSKSNLGSSPIRPKPARCPASTGASTALSCGRQSPASRSRWANRQPSSSYLAETNRPGEGGPLRGPALQVGEDVELTAHHQWLSRTQAVSY